MVRLRKRRMGTVRLYDGALVSLVTDRPQRTDVKQDNRRHLLQ